MPTITTSAPTRPPGEALSLEEQACSVFDRAFERSGLQRTSVLEAFQVCLGSLPAPPNREDSLRDIAKAAALSSARSFGNIIETGRALLGSLDDLAPQFQLEARRCKDSVMLGLADGACQVGPIVYGRFLDIAVEYRDHADEWITEQRRRSAPLQVSVELPVIVPFEEELTLQSVPFREETASPRAEKPPTPEIEQPLAAEAAAPAAPVSQPSATPEPEASSAREWSTPKGKGFFRKLSNVLGAFFGRS